MENFKATEYTLKCVATEREFEDTGWVLEDEKARMVEISASGLRESHVHDVIITKEAPNYKVEN